jgi:hypothetical protein
MNRTLYHSLRTFGRLLLWTMIGGLFAWLLPVVAVWSNKNWGSALYVLVPAGICLLVFISYKIGKSDAEVEEIRNRNIYEKLRGRDDENGMPYA